MAKRVTHAGSQTRRGNFEGGENGLTALSGREDEARAAIDEGIAYATEIEAGCVHVMAGFDESTAGHETFLANLTYACNAAAQHGLPILIEPLNRHDAPGYFLKTTDQAAAIIEAVGAPNLKLIFDCYHVGRTEGDLITRLGVLPLIIGHIQFASVPDRGPPGRGEIN